MENETQKETIIKSNNDSLNGSNDQIINHEVNTENTTSTTKVSKIKNIVKSINLPMAIIIAGIIISIGIMTNGNGNSHFLKSNKNTGKIVVKEAGDLRSLAPVTNSDHVLGDLSKAKVAVVEFSDLQCPYCKAMHPILNKMMTAYADQGVVLVYRHFPLEAIHPFAHSAAHASECVNEIGGNDSFWKFIDAAFSETENNTFDAQNLTILAGKAGVDTGKFDACQSSGKYDDFIAQSIEDASIAGAEGTPDLTVVNLKTNEAYHIGADPRALGKVLDNLLK